MANSSNKRNELTERQRRFVQEYLVDLNGTAAYRRSGYASNSPEVESSKLLRNPKIVAAIKEAQKGLEKRVAVTQEMVVAELSKIAFDGLKDEETGLAYRDSHKMKALELLGKHLGMYIDKQEVKMSVTLEQMLDEIPD